MLVAGHPAPGRLHLAAADSLRFAIIALIAFLTLVDLFAAQAILPSLVRKFNVSRATMGFAVNASTFGMAVAGVAVALFGGAIDRRDGIWISLVVLAVPTALLAFTGDVIVFTLLRVAQGLCMAAAFTLTMAYLAEHFSPAAAAGALAAYVTGNVASNLFGRILSAAAADTLGLQGNFLLFAALNVGGAVLVRLALRRAEPVMAMGGRPAMRGWASHVANRQLRHVFGIGFLILFVFIGTYTYVSFELTAPPLGLSPMGLGLVYFVFLPSLLTTPFAGRASRLLGPGRGVGTSLAVAVAGLVCLLSSSLVVVLAGMVLVAVGTFLAQAIAAGHVGGVAGADKASASGIYLASYYCGGLVGSLVLGQVYDAVGWTASVAVLVVALVVAMLLSRTLRAPLDGAGHKPGS